MQIVTESNVLVSAVLWGGAPSALLELIGHGEVQLVLSNDLINEIREVLNRPKFVKRLAMIRRTPASMLCVFVEPVKIPRTVRDPDDDVVLGTALSAPVDVIVSGDRDLLTLRDFRGIPILSPAMFLKRYYPGIYKGP